MLRQERSQLLLLIAERRGTKQINGVHVVSFVSCQLHCSNGVVAIRLCTARLEYRGKCFLVVGARREQRGLSASQLGLSPYLHWEQLHTKVDAYLLV